MLPSIVQPKNQISAKRLWDHRSSVLKSTWQPTAQDLIEAKEEAELLEAID
jgi:hypothetical protein